MIAGSGCSISTAFLAARAFCARDSRPERFLLSFPPCGAIALSLLSTLTEPVRKDLFFGLLDERG